MIIEAHIRDLLSRAPMELDDDERRGITGLRKWLDGQGCYLKNLGINAIALQPVQEFGDRYDRDFYHWGYMPTSVFAPESSYAQVHGCGSQIEELQKLVAASHRHGIAVVLEVVSASPQAQGVAQPDALIVAACHSRAAHVIEHRIDDRGGCEPVIPLVPGKEPPALRAEIGRDCHHLMALLG